MDTKGNWRLTGKCAKLPLSELDKFFFPDNGRTIKKAKKFCDNCPVILQCLEYALTHQERGIWAGTNEAERNEILKFRAQLNHPEVVRVYAPKIVKRTNITFN